MNKLVAIVGMSGSGKSVVCDYLEKIGYKKIYFGGITMEKLKDAGIEVNPQNEKMMREKIRKEYGMAAYALLSMKKIKEYSNDNIVLDGLYSWDEYKVLLNEFPNLKLICVIVDKDIRYDRVGKRLVRPFSKDEIILRDISEIENLSKGGPIAYADYYIFNNGNIENLTTRVDEIINII